MRRRVKFIAVHLDRPKVSVPVVLIGLVAAVNVASTITMLVMAQ
ncbi:MAG: hypothetical protein ACJ8BC_03230 [Gemmatimonadales bacterium]